MIVQGLGGLEWKYRDTQENEWHHGEVPGSLFLDMIKEGVWDSLPAAEGQVRFMAKKNEFIFNIGFNRENPDHVKVAGILNRLGHGKAEYLARAVLAYESRGLHRGNTSVGIDYRELEQFVRKILEEQNQNRFEEEYGNQNEGKRYKSDEMGVDEKEMKEDDIAGIFMALQDFRK